MEIVFFRILEEFFLFPATFYGGKNLYGKQRNKSLSRWFFVDSSPSDCVPPCPRSGGRGGAENQMGGKQKASPHLAAPPLWDAA